MKLVLGCLLCLPPLSGYAAASPARTESLRSRAADDFEGGGPMAPSAFLSAPASAAGVSGGPVQSGAGPGLSATFQYHIGVPFPIGGDPRGDFVSIDGFDNDKGVVDYLHGKGAKAVCYINTGTWEDWRPDTGDFPKEALGSVWPEYPHERWLDMSAKGLPKLKPVMEKRFDMCKQKGFDAVEPDNIQTFEEEKTGVQVTAQDQLAYNTWLAEQAHKRGMTIGLKNDKSQVDKLLPVFDWALVEECYTDGKWCSMFASFTGAGKPVFAVEYQGSGWGEFDAFCRETAKYKIQGSLKESTQGDWIRRCPAP
jgi:hypothetical protein